MRTPSERTILVTGATSGLGRALAHRLAAAGSRVLIHGRSAERTEETRAEIAAATGSDRLDAVLADLTELRQVARLANDVRLRCDRLDVLVNNAGTGSGAPGAGREESADGIELRFAVNYLAGYHLTRLLQSLLIASAPARVVNVASAGQHPIDFDDPMLVGNYFGTRAYAQSKLAQIMFTFDLAEQLRGSGVSVNALHPATYMNTAMVREAGVSPVSTVAEGVDATMRLVADPGLDEVTGGYFHGTRPCRALEQAYDAQARAQLRDLSDKLIEQARD
ncbi:SDR family NAD(P)-dependent oxidoreductase [Saccharopolyspora phatthalungensis]|uniref:NAD(P)-dependent dehydrogenase (Short-subunit alcohol dehydrogenase family) n=1 Tax=Saccharopolyspora phatthalungensis TaxID=664693 RepID=A0A840QEG7_9PSEU|nr:SDR family NAD(P)-dependent oxidoreductase [Saccharopolyspora phatthalungensis]MBB5158381.1 NAD(P)-dependent dehydrogenase (short-subunit alcohol dehydrogenase family) [Saccharopolyspora phatthalungensis]